jgi:hypothetical protein
LSKVSKQFDKTVEALFIGLFGEYLNFITILTPLFLVKSEVSTKRLTTVRYEKCDPEYLFDNEEDNLQLASFLLVFGLVCGEFFQTGIRPVSF